MNVLFYYIEHFLRELLCHRLVLSICSPVFKSILSNTSTASSIHPCIYLQGVNYETLQSILDFMYQGEVMVCRDNLNSFLRLAKELEVRGLTYPSTSKEEQNLTPEKTKKSQTKINQKTVSSVSLSEKTRKSVLNQPSQSSTSTSEPQGHPSQGEAERRGPTSSIRGHGKRSYLPTSYDSEDEIKVSKVVNFKKRPKPASRNQFSRFNELELEQEGEENHGTDVEIIPQIDTVFQDNEVDEPVVREDEFFSDNSQGLKTEISITENISDGCDIAEMAMLSQEDLASLRVIAESGNQTEEDRDMLATLEEALEGLTKDRLVQVPDKSWKCTECKRIFYAKLSCQNHVESEHLAPDSHVCAACAQKFPTIKALREHVLSGHRKAGEPFELCREVEEEGLDVDEDLVELETPETRQELVEIEDCEDIHVIN
ncbi:protein tramtrack, beta isoform isoform X2 [Eurytemora carolleeae]|uniref:protein tramtrack, beta isoform isoform X2 n=1 Tax=Eurytemora carolleeae TaxID=1294199 RepID=UPI000C7702BE|nr:protein tramtrack, beta isoform isoform X2 [Eurytemora carolleeae]|eukprot:XP_023336201.1 protein tramtrack, beta isoform-like isoform X2 [Eurytemora affinis]